MHHPPPGWDQDIGIPFTGANHVSVGRRHEENTQTIVDASASSGFAVPKHKAPGLSSIYLYHIKYTTTAMFRIRRDCNRPQDHVPSGTKCLANSNVTMSPTLQH